MTTLIIITSVGLGYLSVRDERSHLIRESKMMARTLARTLATTFKYYHMTDQHEHQRLVELIQAVMPHDDGDNQLLVKIYDPEGRLINFIFEHGEYKQNLPQESSMRDFVKGGSERVIKDGKDEFFSAVSPIVNKTGELRGAVEILISFNSISKTVSALVHKFIAFILLTIFLLGMLIYIISQRSIALPIVRLKEASKKLGLGNLGLRIEKTGTDELDDLIEEFNRMAQNIERQNRRQEQLFNEKINLERSLRHRDKLASIGQLTSGLAHEIGTPLNVISGRAEYLLRKIADNSHGSENLKIIIRQADRITKIMQQMLAFSRKPKAEFKNIHIDKIIDDAFALCQLKQNRENSTVVLELQLTATALMGDADGLQQLFVNLMLNSCHAMGICGKILITSRTKSNSPNEIVIEYEDNGVGIPATDRARVFDPFFTTKEVGDGTGLGLFMVSNIVQEHQGRIELDYDFDRGARFIIHLPQKLINTDEQSDIDVFSG